ncbi:hypothetical protein [Pararhizobium antarcticum]|uniref:Uncharacterized protein n=1 Tax=Pararhizobium antarcticum TaxID=1798805 RepID=A0A657LW16_9HYPH|nr:hypothetical protein [Pararhizobium antarcticum]OJF89805.1 hypothetical protein AX761_07380 [Rhizobium sp. 58]OJF99754.1 hypothetical protein AX760_11895 [Pararhizobium antarcticum]
MNVARYADAIADLRILFTDLDRMSEQFQTFDVRLELAAAGNLVVYETRRRKGQTDSLYYGRPAATGQNQQISQATAFSAIDRFFALGQFVALTGAMATGSASAPHAVNAQYPHCAVNFSYRKKGQPVARSMLMVFIGFNDEADLTQFLAAMDDVSALVSKRPHHAPKEHEWT